MLCAFVPEPERLICSVRSNPLLLGINVSDSKCLYFSSPQSASLCISAPIPSAVSRAEGGLHYRVHCNDFSDFFKVAKACASLHAFLYLVLFNWIVQSC